MEGLSTGIDIGYAQVLKPTDQSDYFKLAADMQKTADAVKKAKEEKQKKQKDLLDEQLLKITADLPEKVYTEHQKDIDNQKQTFINNAIKAAETGDLSTKKILELQLEGNRLKSEANQSAAYAKQIETLKKLNPDDYVPSSKEYISQLYSGYNPDGTRNYQVDINKFIEKPNYTKLAQTKIKPLEEDEGEATFTPAGAPGIYKSKQTKVLRLTPEEIDAEKEALWQTAYSNQGNQILLDVKENIERGNPKYSDYAPLVYNDQQGIPQYDKAAEQFFKDNVNLRPIEKKRSVTKFVSERGYKGGAGDKDKELWEPEETISLTQDRIYYRKPNPLDKDRMKEWETLKAQNPNIENMIGKDYYYVNYNSTPGSDKETKEYDKDFSKTTGVNRVIYSESTNKYYSLKGDDVTQQVKDELKKGNIELEDAKTEKSKFPSVKLNIKKNKLGIVDPSIVSMNDVTVDGVPIKGEQAYFTTENMEIIKDPRGPYVRVFEVNDKKIPTDRAIEIPYTNNTRAYLRKLVNDNEAYDRMEQNYLSDINKPQKQATKSTQKSVSSGQKQSGKKAPKIDTKGLTGAALVKARKQNKANGYTD